MRKFLRFYLLISIPVIAILCLPACSEPQNTIRPNIVYILADDLGIGDVSVYNPEGKIKTPNIDKLAAQGIRFTDAHSPSAVCTPTRYGLLTGRYPFRSRKPVGVLRGYSKTLIEHDLPTVAGLLKSQGYQTGVVGKWHLGVDWVLKPAFQQLDTQSLFGIAEELDAETIDFDQDPTRGPNTAGFDYSYILPASLDMPPYCYLENQRLVEKPDSYTEGNKLTSGYTGPFWRAGRKSPSFDFYKVLPTFIEKGIAFLKKQTAQKPFFLYMALTAPHTPWVPDESYQGKSAVGEYGDFVQQVDASVGALLQSLESSGLDHNTLVIFTSDNGPYWRQNFVEQYNHKAAAKFRGMKGDAYEGGHRIPFIAKWPDHIQPNTISRATTCLTNLMATCADLLDTESTLYQTEDSYSILPVLLGEDSTIIDQPAVVHSSSTGYFALRQGDWKLIEGLGSGGFTEPRKIEPVPGGPEGQLFNLGIDEAETNDVYVQNPDKVKALHDLLNKIKLTDKKPYH